MDLSDQIRFGMVEPDDDYVDDYAPEPNLWCRGQDAEGNECEGVLNRAPDEDNCTHDQLGAVMDCDPVWICPVCGREHTSEEVWG